MTAPAEMPIDDPRELEVVDDPSPAPLPVRAAIGRSADLQASGQLPALATMSEEDFEITLKGMQQTRARLRRVHLEVMERGVDYDKIPGTDKDTLLKPGSEILFKMNRCTPRFDRVRTIGDGITSPLITWDSVCYALDPEGKTQAEGAGSCNSWEKKYRWRYGERVCPECGVPAILKSKFEDSPGFFCFKKKNGCGAKFSPNDPEIVNQEVGMIENPDPYDVDNTLKKMSDKRAKVACALDLSAASGSFTQDAEDMDPDADAAPPAKGSAQPAAKNRQAPPTKTSKIDPGKRMLLRQKAARRAEAIGIDAEDASETLLADVLRTIGIGSVDDVTMAEMNAVLQAVDKYELPA